MNDSLFSEDAYLTDDAQFLGRIFQDNRVRHGKYWEKVRYDRMTKLLPDAPHDEWIVWVIKKAIELEILETCQKLNHDTGQLELAVKLVHFNYKPSF